MKFVVYHTDKSCPDCHCVIAAFRQLGLSDSHFDVKKLNNARLDFLQADEHRAFKQGNNSLCGVLILDDTLLQHYGPKKADAAWLKDQHDQSYHWSHNLVNLHYSDDSTDYPIDFRIWKPADLEKIEAVYHTKIDYAMQMVDSIQGRYKNLDLPYAFDTWYTCSELLSHIDKTHGRRYAP